MFALSSSAVRLVTVAARSMSDWLNLRNGPRHSASHSPTVAVAGQRPPFAGHNRCVQSPPSESPPGTGGGAEGFSSTVFPAPLGPM